MSKYIKTIPRERIKRMRIYINTQGKTLKQIVAEEKPGLAITGNFYDGRFRPVCPLKADGTVYNQSTQWNYPVLTWDQGPDVCMKWLSPCGSTGKRSHIANCCGILDREKQAMSYGRDVGGKRGRTGWGLCGGELAFVAFPDGGDGMTPEALRDEVYGLGWTDFILGDGGGKVNYYDWDKGVLIQGNAPSQNLILVDFIEEEDKPMGPNVTAHYTKRNPCYTRNQKADKHKAMLHSTATPGASAVAILDSMDSPTAGAAVEYAIDQTGIYQGLPLDIKSGHCGASGNSTHVGVELCEPEETIFLPINWRPLSRGGKYNRVYAVKRLQQELLALGFDPKGVDGSYGPGCEAAVKAYQKSVGLDADGSVGPATLKSLQRREGSCLRYSAALAQDHFDKVYAYAVELFAWLLKELGGKAEEIVCHSEGYKLGIASNHADVLHWFPAHGKSMDAFRADVKAAMEGKTPVDPLSEAVSKLAEKGIIDSPDYWKGGFYSAANVQALIVKMAGAI